MEIYTGNSNMLTQYNRYETAGTYSNDYSVGHSGLTGFQSWECYMIVKYGNNGNFNVSGQDQYLLELPLYPEQVTESISVAWTTQKVLGRSSPVSAYANTDLKTVNFSLDLHRDLMTGSFSHTKDTMPNYYSRPENQVAGKQEQSEDGPFGTRTWYVNANKMLQIACYPQYTSSGLIPPVTYFIFGQMILKGYVISYQTEWKKPILNSFYGWNSVSISMECYPDSIISANEIIERGRDSDNRGNASTQNTYNTTFPTWGATNSNVMTRYQTNSRVNARSNSSLGGGIRTT